MSSIDKYDFQKQIKHTEHIKSARKKYIIKRKLKALLFISILKNKLNPKQ
jgi:hypothetical protein